MFEYYADISNIVSKNLNKHLLEIDVCWNIDYIMLEIAVQTDVMARMANMIMSTSQEKWNVSIYICPIATVYESVRDIFLLVTFFNFKVSSPLTPLTYTADRIST